MLRRFVIGLTLALLIPGCATKAPMQAYEGPELSKSEVAQLYRATTNGAALGFDLGPVSLPLLWPCHKHETTVIKIDGKNSRPGSDILVLAGQHTARVLYVRYPRVILGSNASALCKPDYETSNLSINFTAKSGHKYRIPAERRGERNWIWVEDVMSGQVIAGEKPPSNNLSAKKRTTP